MNWLLNLFKKKTVSKSHEDKSEREWKAYTNYEAGKQSFFNSDWENALYYFDKSIEDGHYKDDVFEFRGACLQELEYDFDAIEDFNKAILANPNNCNLYYSRSISKQVIFDYEGAISDLESAIALSKIDNDLNRKYNKNAIDIGYKEGILGMYETELFGAKSRLEVDVREIPDYCDSRLKLIKRR